MSDVVELELDEQGRLLLPEQTRAWFGDAKKLYLVTTAEQGAATLSADDPRVENQRILDELAQINAELSDEDYFAPVPDSLLDR
jgi:DNA-binding transcriptional regulator/RsmH inhibitor MraZ